MCENRYSTTNIVEGYEMLDMRMVGCPRMAVAAGVTAHVIG
jgi:hypothetical protein